MLSRNVCYVIKSVLLCIAQDDVEKDSLAYRARVERLNELLDTHISDMHNYSHYETMRHFIENDTTCDINELCADDIDELVDQNEEYFECAKIVITDTSL